jgi:hypothetical protein
MVEDRVRDTGVQCRPVAARMQASSGVVLEIGIRAATRAVALRSLRAAEVTSGVRTLAAGTVLKIMAAEVSATATQAEAVILVAIRAAAIREAVITTREAAVNIITEPRNGQQLDLGC